jgi:hypothetical protein
MNPFEFIALLVLTLSGAGVFVFYKMMENGRRSGDMQLPMAELHVEQLTARITELERHNEELRQQLEWNRRLLEAQDRLLQQLPPPSTPPPLTRV